MLHCDHKPLEPFLSSGMKILKLDHWSMELSDYNLTLPTSNAWITSQWMPSLG